jgi:hypothetical protein
MEALRKMSTDMAKLLTASCAQPIPADPVARLDSANNQLSSMGYTATSLEIAFDGFYAQLDDDQKAGFDVLRNCMTDLLVIECLRNAVGRWRVPPHASSSRRRIVPSSNVVFLIAEIRGIPRSSRQ